MKASWAIWVRASSHVHLLLCHLMRTLLVGVRNIATLQAAIATQTLAYAFPFSSYEFPTDLAFIVLCEGSKSPFVNASVILGIIYAVF